MMMKHTSAKNHHIYLYSPDKLNKLFKPKDMDPSQAVCYLCQTFVLQRFKQAAYFCRYLPGVQNELLEQPYMLLYAVKKLHSTKRWFKYHNWRDILCTGHVFNANTQSTSTSAHLPVLLVMRG